MRISMVRRKLGAFIIRQSFVRFARVSVLYRNHRGHTMCGVVGLIGTAEAATEAFLGLTTLQHRGQDAAGILSYDADGFHRAKNVGLVESVFTRENMAPLTGNLAIGHARYSTIGKGDLS